MSEVYIYLEVLKQSPWYRFLNRELITHLKEAGWVGSDCGLSDLRKWIVEFKADLDQFVEANSKMRLDLESQLGRGTVMGIQSSHLLSSDYPKNWIHIADPPLSFSFWGEKPWINHPCLSVVGSREMSSLAEQWMEQELGSLLRSLKLCVVSGGARGVDQKAHTLALRAGCPTVAILPSGLGQIYPSQLQKWVEQIREQGGCLLSEYAFEQPMFKGLFHHRNRLIAGLSEALLVVEARHRSGTMITARLAAEQGRPVLVVPAHPLDSNAGGGLELLWEGATLVRDAQDLSTILVGEFKAKLLQDQYLVGTQTSFDYP